MSPVTPRRTVDDSGDGRAMTPSDRDGQLNRRRFLAGVGALGLAAACSSGKSTATSSTSTSASGVPDFALIGFSDPSALLPGAPRRLPFGIADKDGVVLTQPPAPSLQVTVFADGQPIGPTAVVNARSAGLPRPYYPVVFTPTKAGIYTIRSSVNGTPVEANVQIPASTTVLGPGQKMPVIDTPTTSNLRGVQLLCTREPACPLHDVSLRDALSAGDRIALLIGTPKYCQTAICGPVLDVLLAQQAQFPSIKMLHAEVYPSDAAAQPGKQQTTETVNAFGLTFEPVLYLAASDGTIVERVDTIFDSTELHDALTRLAA